MSEVDALLQIIAALNHVTNATNAVMSSITSNNDSLITAATTVLEQKAAALENATNLLDTAVPSTQIFSANSSNGTVSMTDSVSGKNTIILSDLIQLKAITLSPDGKTLYVSVCDTDIIAYYLEPTSGLWKKKPGFLYYPNNDVYPGGLLVIDNYLYITNTNKQSNSINIIDTTTGRLRLNTATNVATASFVSGFNVPTAMVTDGTYVYVANTGEYNNGSSISRMNLDGSNLKLHWVSTGLLGPTQMAIHNSSLYVVNGPFLQNNNTVIEIDIKDKDTPHVIGPLKNPDGSVRNFEKVIGLAVVNNELRVIDRAGNTL